MFSQRVKSRKCVTNYVVGIVQNIFISVEFVNKVPYARHYKPRLVIFFTQVSLWLRLMLQTSYVLKKEILQFLSLKSAASNRERLMMARVRYINLTSSNSTTKDTLPRLSSSRDILLCTGTYDILFLCTM